MKKKILYLLPVAVLSLSMQSAFSQKGFDLGFRYLLTESALLNKSDKDAGAIKRENTMSYLNGGIALGYNITNNFGLEIDVLHSRQGQEYSGTNTLNGTGSAYNHEVAIIAMANNSQTTGTYQTKTELNVFKIPLLLRMSSDTRKPVYFTVNLGPQLNILQSAVLEYNKEDVELPGTGLAPKDAYKKSTIDGVLGLGAGFKLSTHWSALAQVRVDYGFQDVENKDARYNFNGLQQLYFDNNRDASHNATAAIMVGLTYKFL